VTRVVDMANPERVEDEATIRSARTSISFCAVVARTPTILLPRSRTSVTLAFISRRNIGYLLALVAMKFRKSHCGIMAMNLQRVGR